jgi:hypothetical protein
MPQHGAYDHRIVLKPDAPAVLNCRVYPMSPEEDKQLNKFIDENLKLGRIVRLDSPYTSGFFFIKKKDGKLRPVQDYCYVLKAPLLFLLHPILTPPLIPGIRPHLPLPLFLSSPMHQENLCC